MRQVSCRALGVVLKAAKRRGVADSVITGGTSYDIPYLRDTKNRIEWEAFCQILRNARTVWSLEELQDLNESFTRSPFFSSVGVIARILFTARDLFAWMQKRSVGGGAQLFGECVKPSYEHVGSDTTVIKLEIVEPFEASPEFFWMTRGAFIGIPRLVGAGTAKVDMTIEGQVGTFRVKYKNRRGTLSALFRLMRWPFTARAAARELQRSNEELQARFYELEDARSKIDRQATQLHTAHVVNELVQRDLDLERTLETIVKALVEEAGFEWAEIETADHQRARAGADEHEPSIVRELVTHGGKPLGQLFVTAKRDADLVERNALLDFIVPSLSMAVENATYRTHLERLVEERTVELRDAQGARERFFAHISHEIRTPLTIITLAVSDVAHRSRDVLDTRAKRNLEAVNEASRKLVRLVDELLLLAAGQEGKLTTHPEPTNLVDLVKSIEAAWQLAASPACLEMQLRAPAALVANVDPVAMERVITNLVSNAVKYTPRGGKIEIELEANGEGIRLSVFDTGPGISEELSSRLFGRYERAIDATATGTGLGLALSRHLVAAHGGTIEALPRPTGGAELRVLLPRELVLRDTIVRQPSQLRLVAHVPVTPDRGSSEHIAAKASQGTVLLAEDDVRLAELVASGLASDYNVLVAHDGMTALELARRHHPHLLITDIDMPGLDGMELARRFRELTGDRLAPIIILSAMLDLGTRLAGLGAGAIDYITKPFDPLELRARVEAQFRARELAIRLHRAEQVSSLGILTSGLAHELRNPANAIVNAIEPLVQKLPPALLTNQHPVGELVDVIRECAEQIRSLSKQLLGMRNEGKDIDVRETSLGDVVQRAMLFAQQRLKSVAVRSRVDNVILRCAPPLLVQALTNLLENAADAAGPNGWVEIAASTNDASIVTIEVTDSGPGVPAELRDRVFEPFFTTKSTAGTGLGLPLAREIIQRHAGTLDIQPRGASSAFVIRLPGVAHAPATTSAGAL